MVASAEAAPNIRQVGHSPGQPDDSQPVVITAKVTDPDGVASVELQYQLVTPGAYVPAFLAKTTSDLLADPASPRQPNPAYQAGWIPLHLSSPLPDPALEVCHKLEMLPGNVAQFVRRTLQLRRR